MLFEYGTCSNAEKEQTKQEEVEERQENKENREEQKEKNKNKTFLWCLLKGSHKYFPLGQLPFWVSVPWNSSKRMSTLLHELSKTFIHIKMLLFGKFYELLPDWQSHMSLMAASKSNSNQHNIFKI